ncbi:PREDICTED: putative F-box protein At1g33020 [Camelina sativa]|uniref:F-box protein At1g33020 n=1 Tax=Camelina sativa TaxID=90675 RepID=A0ABM0VYI8_CAMSA|nr:PREDICTED: putative F-box protein At1g33020 [Camelina sativa]
MNRGENLDSIPIDLVLEIFSRLSAKSVGRCRCVSKLWRSTLGEWLFFSSPQPDHINLYEKSSSSPVVAAADFHMKFSEDISRHEYECSYVSGLIFFRQMWIREEGPGPLRVLCNPITGQYSILQLVTYKEIRSLLGFDPIDKQFKVLRMSYGCVHHVLTLGTGKMKSEKFKFIDAKCFGDELPQLINYKGKLGGIIWKCNYIGPRRTLTLCMLVLKDAEKQEWSKYAYTLPKNQFRDSYYFSVAGVTAKGDIVFLDTLTSKPFYVFYFNPERNTIQRVEILGDHEVFAKPCLVYAFVDHVEDLSFNIMKKRYVATSISPPPPEQKPNPTSTEASSRKVHHHVRTIARPLQDRPSFESINKFNALHRLDDDEQFTTARPGQSRSLFESISKFEAQSPMNL